MLKVGDVAPNFSLDDQHGQRHTLADLVAPGPCVIYFYPADFSPVCTAQTCTFRDRFDDLAEVGTRIIGISPQSSATHQRFADRFRVPFPLLADPQKVAIRAFGVDGMLGIGVRRATFLVGSDQVVRSRVVSDLFLGSHRKLIDAAIAGA